MESAIEAGADAVEFDIQIASDGTPVLFHDERLERTTSGEGLVAETHPDELALLDAGSWFDSRYAGEPVPTLATALDALAGRIGRVYAEIKTFRSLDDVDRVLAEVIDAGQLDRTVFISMRWEALARIRARASEALIGYIVEKVTRTDEGIERCSGDSRALLDFDARILLADPTIAARARGQGVPLATWTVNRVEDAEALLAMGVPRVTTNEVEALCAWRATL